MNNDLKKWLTLLCGSLMICMLAMPVMAKDKDKGKKTPADDADTKEAKEESKEDEAAFELNPELSGNYADIADITKLDAKQQLKLVKVQKAQDRAEKNWDRKNEKKIAQLEKKISRADDPSRLRTLRKRQKKLMAQRDKIKDQCMAKAGSIMKPEQLAKWNSDILFRGVRDELQNYLGSDQEDKAKEVCDKLAKKLKKKTLASNKSMKEKAINSAVKTVAKKVLTKKQKREYAKELYEKQQAEKDRKRNKYRR